MNKGLIDENKLYWGWKFEEGLWKEGIKYIAGVDEVGRGALCGPVVASAVVFNKPFIGWEVIKDSKKLSSTNRLRCFFLIIKNALSVSIGLAKSVEIDKINIRNATHKAMIRAIDNLAIKPDIAVIDGNSVPNYNLLMRSIVKGDNKIVSIAAASIIAKVYRDYLMNEYGKNYRGYGFEKHKGYGTNEHLNSIKKLGITPWHRITFKCIGIFKDNLFY